MLPTVEDIVTTHRSAELKAAAPTRKTVGMALFGDHVRPRLTGVYRPLLHRGDTYACPCCGGTFGSLVAHRGRPNVRCPRCGSMERHRLLWWWLGEQGWLREPGLRILHVAPEWAFREALRKLDGVRYTSADIASRLADEHFDITAIPYPDGSFDLILCNHVLEHVPDDAAALTEMHRVLGPGGRAIVMSPVARDQAETVEDPTVKTSEDRLRVFGQEDHVRLYGSDYVDRVRAAFDDVIVDHPLERLDAPTVARLQLDQRHPIFEGDAVYVGLRGT